MQARSFLAIVAGILVTIVASILVDALMHAAGVFPRTGGVLTDRSSMVALSYRVVITIGAAWLTARLAPNRPMRHAMILGLTGTVLGLIGAMATWSLNLGPRWYPIALAVLAIPQCWVGAKIHEATTRTPATKNP